MERILHFISAVAPSFFMGAILAFAFLKLCSIVIKLRVNSYKKLAQKLKEEREKLEVDLCAVEAEVNTIKDANCETCTRDNPDIWCPTSFLDDKVQNLKLRHLKLGKAARKLERSVNLFDAFFVSPMGKLLSFMGNSDSFHGRRQS